MRSLEVRARLAGSSSRPGSFETDYEWSGRYRRFHRPPEGCAGLGTLVSSWLGRTDAAPVSVPQVEGTIGKGTIDRIAQKLGLSGSVVGPALGYLLPKIIGFLTPDGKIPTGVPPQVSAFLSQPSAAPPPRVAEPVKSGGLRAGYGRS